MSAAQETLQTVTKAFALLDFVSRNEPVTVADLVRAGDGSKTAVLRVLATLKNIGILTQDVETKRYLLGPACRELGMRAIQRWNPADEICSVVESFAQREHQNAILVQLEGDFLLYLYTCEYNKLYRVLSTPGSRAPLMSTSSGMSILAFQSEVRRRDIYANTHHLVNNDTHFPSYEALEEALAQIRDQGYYLDWEAHRKGICAVSVPIYHPSGNVLHAVTFPHLTSQTTRTELERLAQRARALSGLLTNTDTAKTL